MRTPNKPLPITNHSWDNNTTPIVSISCSTYNHELFIRDAIEGFLMQETTFPVEILIHDDASTDRTAKIIKEYEEKYPQLFRCFYQQENTFLKPNRQEFRKPFKNARRGRYIALCEGDDYWSDPLKLQKQVGFLEAHADYSMCFHNAYIKNDDSILKGERIFENLQNKDYTGKEILTNWIVPTASVVYRAKHINAIRQMPKHPDYMYGDIILFLSLAELGKIKCLNQKMSVYRVHRGGIRVKNEPGKKERFIRHQLAIQKSFNGKYRYLTNTVVARYYFDLARDHLGKGCFRLAASKYLLGAHSLCLLILLRPRHFLKKAHEALRRKVNNFKKRM